jgi:hypothetical protein
VTRTLGARQLVPGSSILTSLLLAPPARLTEAEHVRSEPRHVTVVLRLAAMPLLGASAAARQPADRQAKRKTRFMVSPHSGVLDINEDVDSREDPRRAPNGGEQLG